MISGTDPGKRWDAKSKETGDRGGDCGFVVGKITAIISALIVGAFGMWLIKEVAWYLFWAPDQFAHALTLIAKDVVWVHGMVLGVTALLIGLALTLVALVSIVRVVKTDETRMLDDERSRKNDERWKKLYKDVDRAGDRIEEIEKRLDGR